MSLNLELIDLARNIEQKLEQSSHLHFASVLALHRLVKMYGLIFSIFFKGAILGIGPRVLCIL